MSSVSRNMRKILLLFALFTCVQGFAQKQRKISIYPDLHANITQYDFTKRNNRSGIGLGLQVFANIKSKFRPSIELNGDMLSGTKEMRIINGKPVEYKNNTSNLLIGSSWHFSKEFYINAAAGPSFLNSKTHFTVKPALGVYFPSSRLFVVKMSLTHVFYKDEFTNEDFGVMNFGLGIKLF